MWWLRVSVVTFIVTFLGVEIALASELPKGGVFRAFFLGWAVVCLFNSLFMMWLAQKQFKKKFLFWTSLAGLVILQAFLWGLFLPIWVQHEAIGVAVKYVATLNGIKEINRPVLVLFGLFLDFIGLTLGRC